MGVHALKPDSDFVAIKAVEAVLSPLDPRARARVVAFVVDRLGLGEISVRPNPVCEEEDSR